MESQQLLPTHKPKHGKRKLKIVDKHIDAHSESQLAILAESAVELEKSIDVLHHTISNDENVLLSHLSEYTESPYTIIESYFEGHHLERLVRHQIESYNHFVNYQIQRTIQMFNPVTIHSENDFVAEKQQYFLEVSISFANFKLFPPQIHENNGATKTMLPQEAKLRNFTYASTMNVDINIKYIIRNTESMDTPKIIEKTLPKINIGKLPIMLKSSICVLTQNKHIGTQFTGECSMDCGGYFIIKGSEKTVLGQERAAENRVYCFDGKNTAKWNWFAEIKSVPDFKCISPKQIEMMVASKNNGFGHGIYINIPRVKQPIELFVLFRALGVLSDKDISQYIVLDIAEAKQQDILQFLQASMIDANKYMTQEDALRHITAYVAYTPLNMDKDTGARKKREFTQEVLDNDLFPHCQTLPQKLYMVGYMANKLIQTSLGLIPTDDRDSYINKRVELTGTLLNNLFRNYFNKLVKEMQKQIVREINTGSWRSTEDYENIINMTNIYKIMKSTTIENGINRALATGDFSIKQSNSSKVGVAQVLNRLTYVSSLSHLRRINTPLEKSGELIAPRKLHNTTWGFLCLTGDTEVLLSDRVTLKQIKDLRDGDIVTTVNPTTLKDQPSDIHSFFSKMPEKLYAITTFSGRRIKTTGNHPFLVNNKGTCEWKNLEDLEPNDKLVIRHTVKNIPDIDDTLIMIREIDAADCHKMELLAANLLDNHLPVHKLKIFARLVGALNTSGNVDEKIIDGRKYHTATFFVGEECDAYQLVDDMAKLGFNYAVIGRNPSTFEDKMTGDPVTNRTWTVTVDGAMGYLIYLMGGFVDNKQHQKRYIPLWLSSSELSIKREYLSAIQGGTGSPIIYQKNEDNVWAPHIEDTMIVTHDDYHDNTILYMSQISDLFEEFGLKTELIAELHDYEVVKIKIAFDKSPDNLSLYSDLFGYTYCDQKRRASAPAIEFLKIKSFIPIKINARRNDSTSMVTQPNARFKENVIFEEYEAYYKENVLDNGCISVPIVAITAAEPELVYDFTTRSDNHSFVATSFVVHNCPAETPEGQSIGIVKNISYLGHITIPTNSASLYEYVKPYVREVGDVDPHKLYGKVKVFVNGAWVGISENPLELYQDMKEKKYKGIVNIYTSIIFDFKDLEIRICNDGGRLTRPVLRVKDNKALITNEIIDRLANKEISWNDLLTNCKLNESVIEYIDPEEQKFSMIAMKCKDGYLQDAHFKFQYTHCEIHPSTIFGVLASCIPFPEHNQAPRNTYQCAMGKQAIGVYATNYDQRMDKTAYVLNYPSRPLVDTRVMNFIHLNKIPSGTQIHVAIMTHTGYNQEDSVLINKASIDRGLFMATIYHTEKDEDKNIIRDEIIRCKPDPTKTKGIKFGNYDKLMPNGFIPENSIIENRDVIIAKTIPIKENRNDPTKTIKYEDQSKTFRTAEESYVDKNYTGRNGDGYNFAKVRVRTLRKPVLGDKFSSRHGQKGTIGNIIPECDMPFTKNGLRPDIIINPHAIPSRMTIGQLKETLLGKVLLELGMFGDGTSFGNLDVKTISAELQKLGYESYGNELMYNGLTGEQLETNIYIGPVFYQRLKHMVNDKQHSRSIGPMVNLTRQPAEGRSRDGGFRIGEMERDVMIAHGMTRFCKERLYDVSDKYSVHVCKKCGMIASYNDGNKSKMYAHADFSVHLCKTCNNMTDFVKVDIPYAYKLMAQELQTINIVPRLITE
jgi:DNA-directed RNA polymerase beta subunit/intein/homing endonuclease